MASVLGARGRIIVEIVLLAGNISLLLFIFAFSLCGIFILYFNDLCPNIYVLMNKVFDVDDRIGTLMTALHAAEPETLKTETHMTTMCMNKISQFKLCRVKLHG